MRIVRFVLLFGAMVLFAGGFGTSVGALIGYGLPESVMDMDEELSGGRYRSKRGPDTALVTKPDTSRAAGKGAALGAAFGLLLGIVLAFPLALFDQLLLVLTGWRSSRTSPGGG